MVFSNPFPRIAIVSAFMASLAGCSPPSSKLEALAKNGTIQESAPVKADAGILIDAPLPKVWQLISDIDRWPTWQPDITKAALQGPLAADSKFSWNGGGTAVESTLMLVKPLKAISWTGRAMGLKAIHVWTLTPEPGGRVLVRTRESMDGFPITLLYPSSKLQESDVHWLARLKQAAEAH
jgi:uncharacterized protein YndB with AHSA1/START domain